ncbi:MAG: N-acetylmuramoyl-L-alanine amidase [Cytophagaceae bacterium]|nr:N-acetylmuramoyl-L-alanine amidase [Cytophagaceae bacterium]
MLKLAGIILLSFTLVLCSFTPLEIQAQKLKIIVLDAGHGGKDPGCLGKFSSIEKQVTLDITLKLGGLIKKNMPDVKIIYTRSTDKFIELYDRAAIANKNNADLFISIHANSGPDGMHGTETYCMGLHKTEQNLEVAKRENAVIKMEKNQKTNYEGFDPSSPQSYILFSLYQNAYLQNSIRLAEKVEREFKYENRHSRGVKQAGFLVLWKTSMPSVLIETGFLSDSTEAKFLKEDWGRMNMAERIFCALEEYKREIEAEE